MLCQAGIILNICWCCWSDYNYRSWPSYVHHIVKCSSNMRTLHHSASFHSIRDIILSYVPIQCYFVDLSLKISIDKITKHKISITKTSKLSDVLNTYFALDILLFYILHLYASFFGCLSFIVRLWLCVSAFCLWNLAFSILGFHHFT